MAKTTIGKLVVTLTGRSKGFQKMMSGASKMLMGFQTQVDHLGRSMQKTGGWMIAGASAAATALAVAGRSFAKWGDDIAKMSRRTGIATETISLLAHTAELSGASMEDVEKGLRRMASSIIDMNAGLLEAKPAFDALGLSAQALVKLSPEDQFFAFADAFKGMESHTAKVSAAMDIFGRAGTLLLPMFKKGAAGIRHYMNELRRLGVILDKEGARKAELLTDMLFRMRQAFRGLVNVIAQSVVGALVKTATWITNIVAGVSSYLREHPQFLKALWQTVKVVAILGATFVILGGAIRIVGKLLSPGGIIVGIVAGLTLWGMSLNETTSQWIAFVKNIEIGGLRIGDWFGRIGEMFAAMKPVFKAVGSAILATFESLWVKISLGFRRTFRQILRRLGVWMTNFAGRLWEASKAMTGLSEVVVTHLAGAFDAVGIGLRKSFAALYDSPQSVVQKTIEAATKMQDAFAAITPAFAGSLQAVLGITQKVGKEFLKSPTGKSLQALVGALTKGFPEIAGGMAGAGGSSLEALGGARRPAALERGTVGAYSAALRTPTYRGIDGVARNTAESVKVEKKMLGELQKLTQTEQPALVGI